MKIKTSAISWGVTCLYILCIIPLLWVAWYNYPSADDYSMGYRAYWDYKASGGNVFAAIWAALYMAWYDYMNWMGYYTSTFFLSLPPSVFDERLYFLGAYILIGALSLSTIYLFRVIFVRLLGRDKHLTNCITMLTLLITVVCLPRGGTRVEAFYWYCGAANYILMYSFGLFYIGLLLSAVVDEKRGKRIFHIVMACITAILVGGGNYMSSLCAAVFTLMFIVWVFYRKKNKVFLMPAVVNLVAFALSCLAPGNNVRGSDVQGFGFVKTIFISIYYVLDLCINEWTTWAVLLLLVMCMPFMWKMTKGCKLTFKYPLPVLFFGYMFTAANVAPPLFSLANIESGRLRALFYIQYILLLVLCLFYVLGWIRTVVTGNKSGSEHAESQNIGYISGASAKMLCVSAILFAVLSIITVIPDMDFFSTTCAIEDIASGEAAYYRQQNMERRELMLDDSVTDVVVESYKYEPDMIFLVDITTDPEFWTNNSMRRYYGKNSVVRTEK